MKNKRLSFSNIITALIGASGLMWFVMWAIFGIAFSDIHIAGKIITCWLLGIVALMMSGVILATPFLIAKRISLVKRYKRIYKR